MSSIFRYGPRLLLLCGCAMLLSGCYLRFALGYTEVNELSDEIDLIITTIRTSATAAICRRNDFFGNECTYIVGGEEVSSSTTLVSEFGLFGVVVDPLILQVPNDTVVVTATYDDGTGPQPLLVRMTPSFEALPRDRIDAEPGMKFVILELPQSVVDRLPMDDPANGLALEYALQLQRQQPAGMPVEPVRIKAMATAIVVSRGHTYYAPLFPCVNSFSSIPTIEIPLSSTAVDLQPALGDLIRGNPGMGCDRKFYDYSSAPPPPRTVHLPLVVR